MVRESIDSPSVTPSLFLLPSPPFFSFHDDGIVEYPRMDRRYNSLIRMEEVNIMQFDQSCCCFAFFLAERMR